MRLSIVSTMYHSAPYLPEFAARAASAARRLTEDYEIVLVNDGSPDESLAVALDLQKRDPRVRVIDLSRNFGHHPAMLTGLAHASGDVVFLLDCDLEEDPEVLGQFDEICRERDADVVYGVQRARAGTRFDRWSGSLYYKIFNLLSNYPVPENLMTVRLMSRRYVDALLRHGEVEVVLPGLWARTGFRQVAVPLDKKRKPTSTYNLVRKLALLVTSVTSFSVKPLFYIFYLGTLVSALAIGAAAWIVFRRLVFGDLMLGWPSVIVSVWLLGGILIFCQGVIGIYLSKVLMESKRRPLTIVRHIYESPSAHR